MNLNGAVGLGVLLYFSDQASAGMDKVIEKFKGMDTVSAASVAKFEAATKQFKVGVGVMAAGAAVLGSAFALAQPAGTFEQSLAALGGIADASAEEMKAFREAAIQAGIATQFNPNEAVAGLRELAAQGLTAKQALNTLNPVLNFAAGSLGELGVAESAGLASQAMKSFGIDAKDVGSALDMMLKAANLSAIAPKELPMAMGIVSRGAQLMGQSLTTSLVAVEFAKNVMPGMERAATSVAVAMERLAAPSVHAAKWVKQLGVNVTDAKGNFRDYGAVILDIAKRTDGMRQADKALLLERVFGAEGMASVLATMKQLKDGVTTETGAVLQGAEAWRYKTQQHENAAGTAAKNAKLLQDTLPGQMKQLSGSLTTLAIEIGSPFAAAFKPIVAGVTAFVNRIIGVVKLLPDGVKDGIAKLVIGFGALLTLFGGLLAAKAAIVAVGLAISMAGGAIAAVALAMAPVLALIGAGILLFKAFQVHGEESGNGVFRALNKVWMIFQTIAGFISQGKISGALAKEMSKAENSGLLAFAVKVSLWAARIENFLAGMADGFKAKIIQLQPVFDAVITMIGVVADAFGFASSSVQDNLEAFDDAGASGRNFGENLAGIAGIISEGLVVGLGALRASIDFAKAGWAAFGPLFSSDLDVIVGGLKMVIGIMTGDWKMAFRGAADMVAGWAKFTVDIFMAIPRFVAVAIDATNALLGRKSNASGSVDEFTKGMTGKIDAFKKAAIFAAGAEAAEPYKAANPGFFAVTGAQGIAGMIPETIASPSIIAQQQAQKGWWQGPQSPGTSAVSSYIPPEVAAANGAWNMLGPGESLTPPAANIAPLRASLMSEVARQPPIAEFLDSRRTVDTQAAEQAKKLQELNVDVKAALARDIVINNHVHVGDETIHSTVRKGSESERVRSLVPKPAWAHE